MSQTLHYLLQRLRQAEDAEDIFGAVGALSLDDLKGRYRQLVRQIHPDYHPNAVNEAEEAFRLLHRLYTAAQEKIDRGLCGQARQILITSANHRYEGNGRPLRGDLSDLFPAYDEGQQAVLLKVGRNPANNDLLATEGRVLQRLDRALEGDPLRAHFPTLVESFLIEDESGGQRQANVLRQEVATVTLAAVMEACPLGIPAADMAWMFNRLLAALGVIHSQGLVHGAVTPAHLLLRLHDHNGILIDWCYSVEVSRTIAAISPPYGLYYPPEVLAKQPATPATDLYMAAQCMVGLLGGDVASGELPPTVPRPITALLRACTIHSPHRRFQNAWTLFNDFREILERLYGPPQFRPFAMPSSVQAG